MVEIGKNSYLQALVTSRSILRSNGASKLRFIVYYLLDNFISSQILYYTQGEQNKFTSMRLYSLKKRTYIFIFIKKKGSFFTRVISLASLLIFTMQSMHSPLPNIIKQQKKEIQRQKEKQPSVASMINLGRQPYKAYKVKKKKNLCTITLI